ncbi:oligosaccharide flippase family protein [Neptunomonas sp. CHC150]|uniref:oligosaccharide flippase family protein n=1 Tax=Neptunomonas sp. CHC150 TaxID=2998324 RepID=UPI0025AECE70|nr:oligosaccharide flippase family protein [Neptunomonas sp. CHC150]MDN2661071.1 oligosaccharide flippase family protein [Neptunomonas sp. CHC150]
MGIKKIIFQFTSTVSLLLMQFVQLKLITSSVSVTQFGGYSISVVFFTILMILGDSGLGSYTVHKQKNVYHVRLLVFCFIVSLITFSIVSLMVPLWSIVFSFDDFSSVLPFVMLSLPFCALGSVAQSVLLINEKQGLVALVDVLAKLISVFFLYLTIESYGLLAAGISYSLYWLLRSLLLNFLVFLRLRTPLSFNIDHDFRSYSISLVCSQLLGSFRYQADIVVVGVFFGPHLTGIYSIAKQVVNMPAQIIRPLMQRIVLPSLSKSQHCTESLLDMIRKVNLWVTLSVSSMFTFLIFFSNDILLFIGGTDYTDANLILVVMSLTFLLRLAVGGVQSSLAQALGKTKVELRWSLFVTPFLLVSLILGAFFLNIENFTILQLIVQGLISLLSLFLFLKKIVPEISIYQYFSTSSIAIFFIFSVSFFSSYVADYASSDFLIRVVLYCLAFVFSLGVVSFAISKFGVKNEIQK